MKDKLRALLERLAPLAAKLRPFHRAARWTVMGSGATLVALVGSTYFLLHTFPADQFRSRIQVLMREDLEMGDAKVSRLHWAFAPTSFGLGIEAEKVQVKDWGRIESFDSPRVRVLFEPLKLLFGRLPLKIDIRGGEVKFSGDRSKAALSGPWKDSLFSEANFFKKALRLQVQMRGVSLELASKEKRFEKSRVDLTLAGLPGTFSARFEADADIDGGKQELSLHGPTELELDGYFQTSRQDPIGLRIDEAKMHLTEAEVSQGTLWLKPRGTPLVLTSRVQVIFDADHSLQLIELGEGRLRYQKVPIDWSASIEAHSGHVNVRWNLPSTDVDGLVLPLRAFNEAPLKGHVETSGSLNLLEREAPELHWKLTLNNLRFEAAQAKSYFDPSSRGEITLSFVSEGSLLKNRFISPRTELQINGNNAQLEMADGKFIKPSGDRLQLLFKAKANDDQLLIEKFHTDLHTLQLDGLATFKNVSRLFRDQPADLDLTIESNRVDLTRWSSYFPAFRKIPLEGFVQFAGTANGPVFNDLDSFRDLSWRVDRISVANVRGAFDNESAKSFGQAWEMKGPFSLSFLFQGRGIGSRIHRGTLSAQADFSRLGLLYKDFIRKPAGTPFLVDLMAEQSRTQFSIKRGRLHLHELNVDLQGDIFHGPRNSSITVQMDRPIDLVEWRQFFLKLSPDFPLKGRLQWNGRLTLLEPDSQSWEGDIDWRHLALDGSLKLKDLSYKTERWSSPLERGNGELVFSGRSVLLPNFSFEMGGSKYAFSGEARPLTSTKSRRSTLAQFLSQGPWEVNSQLSLDELNVGQWLPALGYSMAKRPENVVQDLGPSLGLRLQAQLDAPWLRESRLTTRLVAKRGSLPEGASFQDLRAVAKWDKERLRLEPLTLRIAKGRMSGSLLFDATPYYARKDAPQSALQLRAENLDTREWLGSQLNLDGRFSGDLQMATEGFEREDWNQHLRARVTGRLQSSRWPALDPIGQSLKDLLVESEASDYLHRRADAAQCFGKDFSADLDGAFNAQGFDLQRADLHFASGSSLSLQGKISKAGVLSLRGEHHAGPRCIMGEARSCLAVAAMGPSRRPASSAKLDPQLRFLLEGPAAKVQLKGFDIPAWAEGLASCLRDRVTQKAQHQINRESQSPRARAEERATRSRVHDIFRNQ